MLGVDQLIPEYTPEGTDAITPAQWAIIGTLVVLLLLTFVLFFFVSRSTREKEEKEHLLEGTLGKVATAIEAMAPETEEEEEMELPEDDAEEAAAAAYDASTSIDVEEEPTEDAGEDQAEKS